MYVIGAYFSYLAKCADGVVYIQEDIKPSGRRPFFARRVRWWRGQEAGNTQCSPGSVRQSHVYQDRYLGTFQQILPVKGASI